MKYFTYKLIATANGWDEKGPRAEKKARVRFEQACRDYQRQLLRLRNRVSPPAWRFFRYAIQDESLHDATLIELTIGDDIVGHTPPRDYFWYRNSAKTRARLKFVNFRGNLTRSFECIGVRRFRCDMSVDSPLGRNLGDLYAYELRAMDQNNLGLSFLFASGAEIEIEFQKLNFRSERIRLTSKAKSVYVPLLR